MQTRWKFIASMGLKSFLLSDIILTRRSRKWTQGSEKFSDDGRWSGSRYAPRVERENGCAGCKCSNEVDVSYKSLMYTNQKSCGCLKREHEQKLNTYLTHVAGTSVDILKSKKVPTDNTTGYKGVYWIRGKYVAKIVFQKKAYYLGIYDDIEEATEARKEAEEVLFDCVAEYYAKWKTRADQDPQWAKENPVQIFVNPNDDKRLSVCFLPLMTESI